MAFSCLIPSTPLLFLKTPFNFSNFNNPNPNSKCCHYVAPSIYSNFFKKKKTQSNNYFQTPKCKSSTNQGNNAKPNPDALNSNPKALSPNLNSLSPNFIGSASRDAIKVDNVKFNFVKEEVPKGHKKGGRLDIVKKTRPSLVDAPVSEQNPKVEASRRGRAGKTVTVISGLQLREETLQNLAKKLKTFLGTGGAVKDGNIEIQGDHSMKLVGELNKLGYKATKSGK